MSSSFRALVAHRSARRVSRHTISVTLLAIASACGGGGRTDGGGSGPPPSVATLQLLDAGTTLAATVGTAVAPVRVRAIDAAGSPVAGARVTWTPSAGGVAPAAATTSADGIASTVWTLGTTAGSQSLQASAPGATAPAAYVATASADRPAVVSLARDTTIALVPGTTVRFSAVVRDRFGNVAPTSVRWSTSDVDVATIDSLGTLRAWNAGSVVVSATADTATGRANVIVARAAPFGVTRVPDDTLRPGADLVVDGTGFVSQAMSATIAGVPALVTGVSATRLVVGVPAQSALPCAAPSLARIVVRRQLGSALDSAVGSAPLDPATSRALQPGERAVADASTGASCTRLVNGGRYVVALVNASTQLPGGVAVQLRGRDAAAGPVIASRTPRPLGATRVERPMTSPSSDRAARAHDEHLERERARAAHLAPGSRPFARSTGSLATPKVGDIVTLNAMFFDCARPTPVRARVAAVGARAVVLEDVASSGATTRDAIYGSLSDEFDRVTYPLITANFGDPLALDARFGGDGHVRILVTPYVADSVPNTVGFVTGCNFASRAALPASNETALFYARPPNAVESASEWQRNVRTTLVHETKHLAAYAERFARAGTGAPVLEETWLEEATARLAEELYARTFSGALWKSNATFAPTVGCELTRCDARPLGVYRHFETLADYYSRVDSLTPLGRTSPFDGTFYSSGWWLVRWAVDQFAADEPTFLRALTTEVTATGITNLARRTGRAAPALLPDWALAMAVDDRPFFTPRVPELTIPSWNSRDLFRGLNAYSRFQFPSSFPLLVRTAPAGDFLADVPLLRSWTSAYVELAGALGGRQLLSAQSPGGGPPPVAIGLAIVRID